MRIFVGVDSNETVAFHVLSHSLMRHAKSPISITPLILNQLPMKRQRDPHQSTEFSYSRFLVPWLCNYQGYAVFMDCDMLCRTDINQLYQYVGKAVSVVKHDYIPTSERKFLDQPQTRYKRKNWSSLMVFDNEQCKRLTPETVDSASGLYLHQFEWVESDESIGEIPQEWNHLVGEYDPNPDAKLVHFTLGTPCFRAYNTCEYAREWYDEKRLMLDYNQRGEFRIQDREAA